MKKISSNELSVRAIKHGLLITRYTTKTSLVRNIQRKEGNQPCFRTDDRECCRGGCEWEDDCKNCLIAAWKR